MKILLTGAGGFIGGHLYQRLQQLGHEVVGIDNLSHASKNPIAAKVLKRDIREPLDDLVAWADLVYHLAAIIHVGYSIDHPRETLDVNVIGTINVLEAARRTGARVVFASTSEIYGTAVREFVDEDHPLNPQSPYAASKLAGDRLCRVYRSVYGININVIRNFNTFGEWQNDGPHGGVVAMFTRWAVRNDPIEILGDGEQTRDLMHVEDALFGHLLSLDTDLPEPVNFGTGREISSNDLAVLIKKLSGSRSEIRHVQPRPGEIRRLKAATSRARGLGFAPKTDLERDLARYIAWYRQHQHIETSKLNG